MMVTNISQKEFKELITGLVMVLQRNRTNRRLMEKLMLQFKLEGHCWWNSFLPRDGGVGRAQFLFYEGMSPPSL